MKRALLIAGGTVGGLGAVLAITPPQLGTTSAINIAGGPVAGTGATSSASASSSASSTAKATAAATKSSKPVATKNAGATKTPASGNSAASNSASPTAAATAAPVAVNGTFTGPAVNVNYGNVQVKITVVNGRITDAVAVKAPTGKNDRYTNMAVPTLKAQTLKAQSANIQGVSGASYTSYGWFTSLQGAIALAGL
jgi:uncharacterized protein with FMN-binding domain